MTTTTEGSLILKEHLLNLGIIGIKLGQFLYTRTDIITKEVKLVLESLLSSNIQHSEEDTKKMLSCDKTNYINNILSIKECLGSGSLAQVHVCYLKKEPNTRYILKVAHPCIFDLEKEVKLLKNILNIFSKFKKINIDWDAFFVNITVQIDLNNEATNMKKFYEIYKHYEKISIPELIYNDKYFIIMTYCEGVPMNKLIRSSKEYILATNLLASCFFHTVYKYNMCHGDMHFGNVLVKPNGYISLIDFGICNYSINTVENYKNEIIYNYREFILERNMSSVELLLSNVIKRPENVCSNFNENISLSFINYFQTIAIDYTKITDIDIFFLNIIFEFCDMYNLQVNGETIYFILQLVVLETFDEHDKNIHNGIVTMRTISYMKTDAFFMSEMKEFILKFYKLEYDHESDYIRYKYP